MLMSGLSNVRDLHLTHGALHSLDTAPDSATRLRALLALQQRIDFYENRTQHDTPLLTRFGLNHDREALAALWHPYAQASRAISSRRSSRTSKRRWSILARCGPSSSIADQPAALDGHKALKTYLMLAEPNRADAAFMTPLLTRYWSTNANLPAGEKLDLSERLMAFYARI